MALKRVGSRHVYPVHVNLLRNLVIGRPNQVWVADINYIRLADEFVYLAVGALRMALGKRAVPAGLIHHSDRGVQYACGEYTQLLRDNQIRIRMSRKGNPYDNARAESFMKTLKHEQVHREEYRNIADARRRIGKFLECTYNRKRLYSALGYRFQPGIPEELPYGPLQSVVYARKQ